MVRQQAAYDVDPPLSETASYIKNEMSKEGYRHLLAVGMIVEALGYIKSYTVNVSSFVSRKMHLWHLQRPCQCGKLCLWCSATVLGACQVQWVHIAMVAECNSHTDVLVV